MIVIKHGGGRYELHSRRGKIKLIRIEWGMDSWDGAAFTYNPGVSICKWLDGTEDDPNEDDFTYLVEHGGGYLRRSTVLARRLWRILERRIGHEIDPSCRRDG